MKLGTGDKTSFFSLRRLTMAAASGCSLAGSTEAASREKLARRDRRRQDLATDGLPFRQRAGLVEHERVDFLQCFERLGVPDEHADLSRRDRRRP